MCGRQLAVRRRASAKSSNQGSGRDLCEHCVSAGFGCANVSAVYTSLPRQRSRRSPPRNPGLQRRLARARFTPRSFHLLGISLSTRGRANSGPRKSLQGGPIRHLILRVSSGCDCFLLHWAKGDPPRRAIVDVVWAAVTSNSHGGTVLSPCLCAVH